MRYILQIYIAKSTKSDGRSVIGFLYLSLNLQINGLEIKITAKISVH